MNKSLLPALMMVALFGCFGATQSQSGTTYGRTYLASDAGKRGVPDLSGAQRRTLAKILRELPTGVRRRIRFVFSGAEGGAKTTFLVLDPGPAVPAMGSSAVQTFRVLNAPCNYFYDPARDYVFVGTSCGLDPEITG